MTYIQGSLFKTPRDGKVPELNRPFVSFSSFVIFHLTANKKLLDTGRVPWCSSVEKPEFVHLVFSHSTLNIFAQTNLKRRWQWLGEQTWSSVLLFTILPANTFPLPFTISIFSIIKFSSLLFIRMSCPGQGDVSFQPFHINIPVFSFCLEKTCSFSLPNQLDWWQLCLH